MESNFGATPVALFFIFATLNFMIKSDKTKKIAEEKENKSETIVSGQAVAAASPNSRQDISKELEEMFLAGVHFGYSRVSLHPKIKPYIFGLRNNVEIFDLEKTRVCLQKAKKFLEESAKEGKRILIVSTKPGIRQIIEQAAKKAEMPYVSQRWLGGTLTNFKVIKSRLDYFVELRRKKISGELNKYTKKEISHISKELLRLERFFNGLEKLAGLPCALLIVDPKEEKTALREAKQMSIPVIAVLNSDCDPTNVAYPIPANDASVSSVKYLMDQLMKDYSDAKLPH